MARLGMIANIQQLRTMAQVGTSEYDLQGETYFTNDHLQTVLDRHRTDIYQELVEPIVYGDGTTTTYKDYYYKGANAESANSGTAIWQLQDTGYVAVGTADYTVDYNARLIRFTASTDGGYHFLTYRTYNMNAAAAEVWRMKAANVAGRFDVRSDNHDLKRSQLTAQYLKMADYYDKLSQQSSGGGSGGGRMKTSYRVDVI